MSLGNSSKSTASATSQSSWSSMLIVACLLALCSAQRANADVFAGSVLQLIPGSADFNSGSIDTTSCRGSGITAESSYCLGPPDLRYLSIGEGGILTVALSGAGIPDRPGNDIVVWGTCNASLEPGRVLLSENGVDFYAVGDFTTGVSKYFDMGTVGLSRTRFVRFQDLPGGSPGLGMGFDVDAVGAFGADGSVANHPATWGELKVRYR